MTAYYNEIDKFAAQWLHNLIDAGHIAPGVVDTRSIEDVTPNDLNGFKQCHFFAGVGVWSYALRRAGWSDDRRVWTGSCPCQPFSAAGKGAGFDDERHLWPAFQWLIEQCRPESVFGEQVASKDADVWIDLVHTDMEALGYAFGAVPFPSAGVGAPHIRDRLYWVADATDQRLQRGGGASGASHGRDAAWQQPQRLCDALRLDNTDNTRSQGHTGHGSAEGWQGSAGPIAEAGLFGRLADTQGEGPPYGRAGAVFPESSEFDGETASGLADDELQQRQDGERGIGDEYDPTRRIEGSAAASRLRGDLHPGPTNGFWRDSDWLGCRDGKFRPVEPGTFPLAHGATSRVGRLRAYGNAINAEAAISFIEAFLLDEALR